MIDLRKVFAKDFEVQVADTDKLRNESFHIRYQVYCVENPFEDASRFPDKCETDVYDRRAVHALIRHKPSGLPAATVRLVLPDPHNPAAPFPIETSCGVSVERVLANPGTVPRGSLAEISRFAVSKTFKRRVGEKDTIAGVSGDVDSYPNGGVLEGDGKSYARMFPHITLGLFQGIVSMSAEHGITHWYAVMEPSLFRLLTRFGIRFVPVGPLADYHGLRQPCFGVADEILSGIYDQRRDVWELITDGGRVWPPPEKKRAGRTA